MPAADRDIADFDDSQLKELASILPVAQVLELAQSYREAVREIMGRMLEAADAQNLDTVRYEAHDLKGTAGNFGAVRLRDLSQRLEEACDAGAGGEVATLTAQLQGAAEAAWRAIESHLALGAAAA